MVLRLAKVLVAVGLSLLFTISLAKLVICIWNWQFVEDTDGVVAVENWLHQNRLGQYTELFIKSGE